MAEAVFSDPALRERFEEMAKRTAESEPVRDDFEWLAHEQGGEVAPLRRRQRDVSQRAFDVVRQITGRHEQSR